jgi:hypothetical protein
MEAFWAVFTFGGSGPAITAHGSLDLKQEIQIQIQMIVQVYLLRLSTSMGCNRVLLGSFDFTVLILICLLSSVKKSLEG